MWLSEQSARAGMDMDAVAETGRVTIGGKRPAVVTDGEHRNLDILSPGGVAWLPAKGQETVVISCGDGTNVVAGAINQSAPADMLPGEVFISSGAASVYLRRDGSINLTGRVNILGTLFLNGTAL